MGSDMQKTNQEHGCALKRVCVIHLTASPLPLPPAPLAIVGFLVAGLVAWQYSDRLGYLLACFVFAVWYLFCSFSLLQCAQVSGSEFHDICLASAVASLLLTIAHCFKTLSSDRVGGLLRCYFCIVWCLFY